MLPLAFTCLYIYIYIIFTSVHFHPPICSRILNRAPVSARHHTDSARHHNYTHHTSGTRNQSSLNLGHEIWTRNQKGTRKLDTKRSPENCVQLTTIPCRDFVSQISCPYFVSCFCVHSTRNDSRRRVIVCGGGGESGWWWWGCVRVGMSMQKLFL